MNSIEILEEALKQNDRFMAYEHASLLAIAQNLFGDTTALLCLFDFYQNDEARYDGYGGLSAIRESDSICFAAGGNELTLSEPDFFVFLGLISDISLPVLPLGSVVRVQSNRSPQDQAAVEENPHRDIPLLITERFTVLPGTNMYFPYGGVLYPAGALAPNGVIHFGPQFIGGVVFRGYSDDSEESFTKYMREELILKRGYHSMAFAPKDEVQIVRKAEEAVLEGHSL